MFDLFKKISFYSKEYRRRRDINVNVGIGKTSGTLDYYRMSLSPMNTFSKEFAEKAIAQGVKLLDVVKVPVITMKELLDRYLPMVQPIRSLRLPLRGFAKTCRSRLNRIPSELYYDELSGVI